MPFDVAGARKAGYSDSEIADYLAPEQKFDVEAARKSGYDDSEIVDYLSSRPQKPGFLETMARQNEANALEAGTPKENAEQGEYLARGAVAGVANLLGTGAKIFGDAYNDLFGLSREDAQILGVKQPRTPGAFLEDTARGIQSKTTEITEGAPEGAKQKYDTLEYLTADPSKSALLSPTRVTRDVLLSLPSTLALMVTSRFGGRSAQLAYDDALTAGASEEAAKKAAIDAAMKTVTRVGAASEGVIGYGQQATQVEEQVNKLPRDQIEKSPEYQALIKEGKSPEVAQQIVASRAATLAGFLAGTVDAATNLATGPVLGKIIGEGGGLLSRSAKGAATEAVQEGVQSGGEQVGSNYATQRFVDPNQSLTEGVGEQMVQGAVLGGVTGAGASAAFGHGTEHEADSLINNPPAANVDQYLQHRGNELSGTMGDFAPGKEPAAAVEAAPPPSTVTPEQKVSVDKVLGAGSVDEAITAAAETATASPTGAPRASLDQMIDETKKTLDENLPDQLQRRQAKVDALVANNNMGVPLQAWEPDAQNPDAATVTPEFAKGVRDLFSKYDQDVVFVKDIGEKMPFDGAVDDNQPNTIFMSSDPTRAAAQVSQHELGHTFESVELPDGRNLNQLLKQQIMEGATGTLTDRNGPLHLHSTTAPDRASFPSTPEGQAAHADAALDHIYNEVAKDMIGDAPRFAGFIDKVSNAVEERYGAKTATDVIGKLVTGLREAFNRLQGFFKSARLFQSEKYVNNLDQVHDTIAKMHAAKLGEVHGLKEETAAEPTVTPEAVIKEAEKPARVGPAPREGYALAKQQAEVYKRWLGELDEKRREDAEKSPEVAALRAEEKTIVSKVRDERYLTKTQRTRLARIRADLESRLNPQKDSADMAHVRRKMVEAHQHMADAASVSKTGEAKKEAAPKVEEEKPVERAHDAKITPSTIADEHEAEVAALIGSAKRDAKFSPKQTQTPEFKKWFGDSKIVDKDGKPLVVYHGTKADIEIFGKEHGQYSNNGMYFTADPGYADVYARYKMRGEGAPATYPVYLRIENPLVIRGPNFIERLKERLLYSKKEKDERRHEAALKSAYVSDKDLARLKALGHDGIVNEVMNEIVVLSPAQIKSAVGNNGKFDTNNPDIRFSPKVEEKGPVFYSALERGVDAVKFDKAPPGQWLATIKNMPGIKAEEIQTTRIDKWLNAQTGPVTKAQVLEQLELNSVKIEEVQKGARNVDAVQAARQEYDDANARYNAGPSTDRKAYKAVAEAYEKWAALRDKSESDPVKFSQYVLPGGENYRELLMTLPGAEKTKLPPGWKVQPVTYDNGQGLTHEVMDDNGDQRGLGSSAQDAIDDALTSNDKAIQLANERAGYRSSHWSEKNVLAHIRFDDRTGPNGEKILHIAEIQSDWHQQGRREGYRGEKKSALSVKDEGGIWRVRDANGQRVDLNGVVGFSTEEQARRAIDSNTTDVGGVPDAPFKTTWHELAMKRALRYAAENGYDRVTWDTGATAADRFDISKSVSKIEWTKIAHNGTVFIEAYDNEDGKIIDSAYTREKLPDVIGKDLADKIIASKAGEGVLEGEGLKVGGEGMKGFYDKILPNFVSKYVKKWGAKVETTTFDSDPNRGEFDQIPYIESGDVPVHSLNITPEMRKSLLQGQPKFSPRAKAEQAEGKSVPVDVAKAGGYENSERIASSKRWQTGRELKAAIQDSVNTAAKMAGVDLTDRSTKTSEHLVRSVTADVMHALKANAGAIGWYDLKTRQALAVASLVHPEIAKDPNARFAFVYALAATSNGIKVDKNFDYANQVYEIYKETGKMPTHLKMGLAQESINKTLDMFNRLVDRWGPEKFRKFMLTNYAMKEITALTGVKPAGEHADTIGRGAAIMGPKIGNGFFSNLYGHFDALTMDRWLIRTWGRHTGTLIVPQPELVKTSQARMSDALRALPSDELGRLSDLLGVHLDPKANFVDDMATAIKDASADPKLREQLASTPEGDELRKAAINLAKYLDGQKEAPEGPHERTYIRKIFNDVLAEVRKDPRYSNISMADMQAVLWYAEKRLYEHAKTDVDTEETGGVKGYEEENEAPDYANAAVGLVKNINESVLNDPTLSEAEKGARIVSDRRISAALAREERGRPTETQSGPAAPGAGQGSQPGGAGGFTDREKRAFAGAVAAQDVRSARISDEAASHSYQRESSGDGGKLRVLKSLGVSYVAEWKAGSDLKRIYRKNGVKTPTKIVELAPSDENAARFQQLITEAKAANKSGAAVAVYPAEDYKNFRLLLSDSGKSGAAVKPDGDIISVFSTDGTGHAIFEAAIAAGGRKLDAFDTVLPDFYHSHGFIEAARTKWNDEYAPEGWDKKHFADYNNGEPDVVLMVLDRGNVSPELAEAKVHPDWDSAAAAQEKLLRKMDKENPGAIINARLDRLDGKRAFTLAQAEEELKKIGVDVVASRVRKDGGQSHAVLNLSRPLSAEEATAFSTAMKQEAITQFADGKGAVYGPAAEKWQPFDPAKFQTIAKAPEAEVKFSPRLPASMREPAPVIRNRTPVIDELPPEPEKEPRRRALQPIEGTGEEKFRAINGALYNVGTEEPQMNKAAQLVERDPKRALAIAMREVNPPEDLHPEFVYMALEEKAKAANDFELQERLSRSRIAEEATTMGQRIAAWRNRSEISPVDDMRKIREAREARNKARGVDAEAKINEVVDQARAFTRRTAKSTKRPSMQDFILSIVCKT